TKASLKARIGWVLRREKGTSMRRSWKCVLAGWLCLPALAGCAGRSRPVPAAGTGPRTTIIIGATRLDPSDVTISASDLVGFASTAGNPLQVEFVQPETQTGKITCRLIDPPPRPPARREALGRVPDERARSPDRVRSAGSLPERVLVRARPLRLSRPGGGRADATAGREARAARVDHGQVAVARLQPLPGRH